MYVTGAIQAKLWCSRETYSQKKNHLQKRENLKLSQKYVWLLNACFITVLKPSSGIYYKLGNLSVTCFILFFFNFTVDLHKFYIEDFSKLTFEKQAFHIKFTEKIIERKLKKYKIFLLEGVGFEPGTAVQRDEYWAPYPLDQVDFYNIVKEIQKYKIWKRELRKVSVKI